MSETEKLEKVGSAAAADASGKITPQRDSFGDWRLEHQRRVEQLLQDPETLAEYAAALAHAYAIVGEPPKEVMNEAHALFDRLRDLGVVVIDRLEAQRFREQQQRGAA